MIRTKQTILAVSMMVCALALLGSAAPFPPPPAPGSGPLFVPEKGSFRILADGKQVGKEEFDISSSGADWVARGTSEVKTGDTVTHISGTLELHSDGTPVHYEWSTQGAKKASSTIGFNGPTAMIDLQVEGTKPYTQQFTFKTPQIVILDNNLYYQYAVLARIYDWDKKGQQTFAVLVPQELTPGSVTVESAGPQDVDGKKLQELTVKTEDLEVDLYLDGERLIRISTPGGNAEIIRD